MLNSQAYQLKKMKMMKFKILSKFPLGFKKIYKI